MPPWFIPTRKESDNKTGMGENREIRMKEYKAPEEHEKLKQHGAERTGESSVIIGKGAH